MSDAELAEHGFLPFVSSEPPIYDPDNFQCTMRYGKVGDHVTQVYDLREIGETEKAYILDNARKEAIASAKEDRDRILSAGFFADLGGRVAHLPLDSTALAMYQSMFTMATVRTDEPSSVVRTVDNRTINITAGEIRYTMPLLFDHVSLVHQECWNRCDEYRQIESASRIRDLMISRKHQ